jgi:imidazole glycerol-phosphate synthase subunit HisH
MKVGIINYGMGNLGSVRRALEDLDAEVVIADRPELLSDVDRMVLPGVGAFGEAMARLRAHGWEAALQREVHDRGKVLLGICLGMQMLGTSSDENGLTAGLGFIPGEVRRLDAMGCGLRIPHVGWNDVRFTDGASLFAGIPQSIDFYFVHSYALDPGSAGVCATARYDADMAAAVELGRVLGTQFHPEKSSVAGRQVLRNFLNVPSSC